MARDDDWRTPPLRALAETLVRLETADDAEAFLRDLCTLAELRDLAQRWEVARLLDGGLHYAEISRRTGASTATITRIASWLHHGEGGYRRMLGVKPEAPPDADSSEPAGTSRPSRPRG